MSANPAFWSRTKPGDERVELLFVTPEMAAKWLMKNIETNRNIKPDAIDRYASDMAEGRWIINGETVKFLKDGTLIDGQNRLNAVIKSKVPGVWMIVVFGLRKEAMQTIDIGVKRKNSDILKIMGIVDKHAKEVAAAAGIIHKRETGSMYGNNIPSAPRCCEIVTHNRKLREAVEFAVSIKKDNPLSVVCSAIMVFWCDGSTKGNIRAFLKKVAEGVGLQAGDPALALAKNVQRAKNQGAGLQSYDMLGRTVVAWNAYIKKRPLKPEQIKKTSVREFPELML